MVSFKIFKQIGSQIDVQSVDMFLKNEKRTEKNKDIMEMLLILWTFCWMFHLKQCSGFFNLENQMSNTCWKCKNVITEWKEESKKE